MDERIVVSHESERACGYRTEPGAVYLVGRECYGVGHPDLPIPLLSRDNGLMKPHGKGWEIIRGNHLWREWAKYASGFNDAPHGWALLFAGNQFYSPEDLINEANELDVDGQPRGMSRRIAMRSHNVPETLVCGERGTWVMVAHIRAMTYLDYKREWLRRGVDVSKFDDIFEDTDPVHGIVSFYRLHQIQMIVTGAESKETIDDLIQRGFTPVLPVHMNQNGDKISAATAKAVSEVKKGRPMGKKKRQALIAGGIQQEFDFAEDDE